MHFSHLPNEIYVAIIEMVPPDDFLRLAAVNHVLRHLSAGKLRELSDAKRFLHPSDHGEMIWPRSPSMLAVFSVHPQLRYFVRRYTPQSPLLVDVEDEDEDNWGQERRPVRSAVTQGVIDMFRSKCTLLLGERNLIYEVHLGIPTAKDESN